MMESKFVKETQAYVSAIFEEKPERWGYRGDPYLWEEMKNEFAMVPITIELDEFIVRFKATFEKLSSMPLTSDSHVFLSKHAHGGMSGGQISGEFWLEEALPLLVERLKNFK